nr:MAG TPA: hypothetical protein [Caudoviricetes sp.]
MYIKLRDKDGGVFPHITTVFSLGVPRENQEPIKVIDSGTHTSIRLGQYATICCASSSKEVKKRRSFKVLIFAFPRNLVPMGLKHHLNTVLIPSGLSSKIIQKSNHLMN